MNRSDARRFDDLYRRLWGTLHRGDDPDGLGQHERELLSHVGDGTTLGWLTRHLLLPKSSASVLVKDLERRGYVRRHRDPDDERRLRVTLTAAGAAVVRADTVLDLDRLGRALRRLPAAERRQLLATLERFVTVVESASPRT
jgi:DNA-binding MarR family transcriptional regulator